LAGIPNSEEVSISELHNPWLDRLRDELHRITAEASRKYWPGDAPDSEPYFNYRLEHVLQVERYAGLLLGDVGGDIEIVAASVWIHDRFKPVFEGADHAARAVDWIRKELPSYGFPLEKLENLSFAVGNHVGYIAPHDRIPPDRREARILWDADKLDKFGLHAIVNYIMAHAVFPPRLLTHEKAAHPIRPLPAEEDLKRTYFYGFSLAIAQKNLRVQKKFFSDLRRELGLDPDGGPSIR
jgi:HD superfamily phosphodiesterase